MRMKILSIFLFLFLALFLPQEAHAQKASGSSAILSINQPKAVADNRVKILKGFLESYNSPLASFAEEFVSEADRYNIDWKLVTAISGVESTFGRELPGKSYNAWGWGIYGDNIYYFPSYEEAIRTITKSLREEYMNKWGAQNVYQIGEYYAASPTWAQRVTYFMDKIEAFGLNSPQDTLSLTL